LRPVARELSLDPKSLLGFLEGAKPRVSTRTRLNQWYLARIVSKEVVFDVADLRIALKVLLQEVPPDRLERAAVELVDALQTVYRRTGSTPAWLDNPAELGKSVLDED
jgi:hypothetical protein